MEDNISHYLESLNSISVNSSVGVFRRCFDYLSDSFSNLGVEELDVWIKKLSNSALENLWAQQKVLKYPSLILYHVMWDFRNQALRKKEFIRETSKTQLVRNNGGRRISEITDKINLHVDELSVFDGVVFLGELISAWMLTCPKSIVVEGVNTLLDRQPSPIWLRSILGDSFEALFSNEELVLLFILDYRLYYAFEDLEARNTK